MGRLDVGDDEPALGRAWRGRRESLAERDRGPGAWGCELDDAEPVERRDVIVEPPTQSLVEPLGSVDVGHGDDLDFELHVDTATLVSLMTLGTSVALMALLLSLVCWLRTHRLADDIADVGSSASSSASQGEGPESELTLVLVLGPRLMTKLW